MHIGIIGCGKIFHAYAKGAAHYADLDLVACADLDPERAAATAGEFDVPWHGTVDDLLARDDVGLVLNLTIPAAHAAVDQQILAAGKHAYSEKPLALSVEEFDAVAALAAEQDRLVGCAPDTFLSANFQAARRLVDAGDIGQVIAGVACMACPGHESWHPSPAFYYQAGGGPLFDMGPYYLTALVSLLGPVAAVCGFSGRARKERLVTSEPLAGSRIPVEIDTHYSATLHFAGGALITLIMSFDVHQHRLPKLELYGTDGTLYLPDPNTFGGAVSVAHGKEDEPTAINVTADAGTRGAGAADLIQASQQGRGPRADYRLARHVLDIMQTISEAARTGRSIELQSTCDRPAPLADGELALRPA